MSRADRLAAAALLLAALVVLAVATPRLIAHALMRAGEAPMAAFRAGGTLDAAGMKRAMDSRRAAVGWAELPDAAIDLGGLYLAEAARHRTDPLIRRALLDRSLAWFRRGLRHGPARPYAWAQYAQAAFERGLPGEKVSRLLALSLTQAPDERPLVIQRVKLGFRARAALTAPVARRIDRQVALMAQYEPWPLARFARERYALRWVRRALADRPALRDRFDRTYLRLPPA